MFSKEKSTIKIFLFFIALILSFSEITSQKIKDLELGKPMIGRMEIDESHEYFKLVLPESIKGKLLQITTKQNKEEEIKEDEPFSDPDVYVSKINKYPSSPRSSEWYSERYGSDVLTIPAEALAPNDILYIGMYCQFKCRYHLNVNQSQESEIKFGEYNIINLGPHETINYKFYVEKEFDELNVVAYSDNGKFRIFMNKKAPSSQNTFNVIPSWSNGYVFQIRKENPEQYCTECYYHVVIHNEGEETINSLTLFTDFPDKIFNIKPEILLYDAVEKDSKKCYSFDITAEQKKEKLIIQTNMYSGYLHLAVDGWVYTERKFVFPFFGLNNVYRIESEHFLLLDEKDFKSFDEKNSTFKDKDSKLHFCYYSRYESSFSVNVYFLSRIENIQETKKANILTPSRKIRTYLLKDQMMKYELTGLNLEKKDVSTNITLTTTKVVGTTKTYAYFCKEEKCLINKDYIKQLNESGNLLSAYPRDYETDLLYIPYEKNKCFKKPKITLSNKNVIDCAPIVGVLCENPNENGLCVFDIQLHIREAVILMTPKQMYYGSIPIGKNDYYKVRITDENIHSLVVVLNSESGDAELSLFRMTQNQLGPNEGKLISMSYHNDYIPDVIRITPAKIKRDNLLGDYIVRVSATCYSNYNLYYYVIYTKDKTKDNKNIKLPEVTMNIEIGQVITDYFPNDIRYKIYSFTPVSEKSNLKVFLDRVNVDFTLYIYSDISNFKIKQMYEIDKNNPEEPITGYDWKSQGNNEINLLKSDSKFKTNQMYYIVIAPNLPKEPSLLDAIIDFFRRNPLQYNQTEIIDKKAPIKFYLGVTELNEQITISEGIPHTLTLDKNYNGQNYFYEHNDLNEDFELDINVIMGKIDIFIDVKEINEATIEALNIDETKADIQYNENMIYKLGINKNFDSIIIPTGYLQQNKQEDNSIKIYFYIRRSKTAINDNQECKYTIIQKSSNSRGVLLQPGLVKNSKIVKGQKHFYIIEEVKKRKTGGVINVNFNGGSGNIYVKVPKVPESKNIRFPSIADHDYKGQMVYSGKIVKIPPEVYERLNSETLSLQILITVEGGVGTESESGQGENLLKKEEIYYSISYSNDPKTISQNEPYDGYITKGEFQYFSFYFDENVKNIYFGLYNMNGDADMYLNYGLNLPTPTLNDWKTTDLSHEYIDLNLDNDFFKKENLESLSGYYTLLLEGFTNSSFSLFVSTHPQRVLPLRNNRPVVCTCRTGGEKCYLRYNEVFDKENKAKGILNNNIIFTTKYLYGNGKMYAKLFKDSEIHGGEFYKFFPDEQNYDISNKESNQRNYMKMKIQESIYSEDSAVLMTFICEEKTQVDISATILRHYSSVDFIQENKENVFFVGKKSLSNENIEQPDLKLYFNNFFFNRRDFIYSIHSYVGDAHFKVYSNNSRWDITQQKEVFEYNLFKEFDVLSSNEDSKDNIEVYNPYSKDYFGVITSEQYRGHQNFVFQVIPKNEFGFYIQCNYEKDWNEISIEKSKNYYARRNRFYGYFDISEDYGDLEIALSIERNILLTADLYVKINIVDTTKKLKVKEGQNVNQMSIYHYSYPSEDNYDYHIPTEATLGTLAFNINNLPKLTTEERQTKFVRALIYVKLNDANYEPMRPFGDHPHGPPGPWGRPGDGRFGHRPWEENDQNWPVINIVVTPGVSNVKYVEANANEYYFSNLTYAPGAKRETESKIYTLRVQEPGDDLLVIEISSCLGNYELSITDILDNAGDEKSDKDIEVIEKKMNGKKVIYVPNLKSKVYYLTIRAKMNDVLCQIKFGAKNRRKYLGKDRYNLTNDEIPKECANNLVYLMYYYTMKKDKAYFNLDDIDNSKLLIYTPYGKGKVRIEIPQIIKHDINNNNKTIEEYKFDIFATKNERYYKRMGSVCYLSQFKNYSQDTIFKIDDVKYDGNKYLIISGLGYRQKYFINVLAQSTTSKELIAFSPFVMWAGGYLPFPIWQTALVSNIIIIVLIILLVFFIRKYCGAKGELKIIKGDTLPKMESEVNSHAMEDRIVYSGLGSSY